MRKKRSKKWNFPRINVNPELSWRDPKWDDIRRDSINHYLGLENESAMSVEVFDNWFKETSRATARRWRKIYKNILIEVISVSRPEFNHVFMESKKDWWSWFTPKWSHEWRKKNDAQLEKMFESEIAYEIAKCFTYPFNEYVHAMTLSQSEQTRFLDNYSRLNKFDLEKEAKLSFKLMDVDPRYTY